MRKHIGEDVKRRIYAESMGKCMNPNCKEDLFKVKGDIMEKAHIVAYCKTVDNSYENLIILCPNCHTNFDLNDAYTEEEVKEWKRKRAEELESFFQEKYSSFDELKEVVTPMLLENQTIFNNYYLRNNRNLWDDFEGKILSNNRMIKNILKKNISLIQRSDRPEYSNQKLVYDFLLHIDEFELTRQSDDKTRQVLFPEKINSLFAIKPLNNWLLPSVEAVEKLIEVFMHQGIFSKVEIGVENPYIEVFENDVFDRIYLNDVPRLRQLYNDYKIFKKVNVRLESLNFALKVIDSKNIKYNFLEQTNLRQISIKGIKMQFVYEYCLSKIFLQMLSPDEHTVILNLHNWNGDSCISPEAYEMAEKMNVKLLTMDDFYVYLNKIK